MMYGGWSWGWGVLMMLISIGVVVLIIWGIVTLIRNNSTTTSHTQTNQNPIGIAKERYAKGEITKEQFDQIKKDLNQ